MKLGLIAAMTVEAEKIKEVMTEKTTETVGGITFVNGKLGETDVVCAVCGIGKVCAAMCAQTMIVRYAPDAIVNTGIAGTLSDELGIGDIAVSNALVQHDIDVHDLDRTPRGYHPALNLTEIPAAEELAEKIEKIASSLGVKVKRGVIATGDQFISSSEIKKTLVDSFGAIACEMEGGAVAQVCYMNKVPFAVVRAISDGANEQSFDDYPAFEKFAAEKSSETAIRLAKEL